MDGQATCVVVRLRPSSSKETGVRCIKPFTDGSSAAFINPDKSQSLFSYDKVYGEDVTQAQVFEDCRHIISSVLKGYNGTILAYGQTGSGKTHTLIGSVFGDQRGMVPRAVAALGEGIAADTSEAEYEVRLSVVEIYCERIRDLLDPNRDNLQVKQDASGAIFIEGALEAQVGSEEQLVEVMHTGLASRTVAATCMNEVSSRSHCIVTVTVEKTCADGSITVGKLKMVDLAGSERQDKTHAAGQTLVEGSQINKSLSALANVIYALTDSPASSNGGGASGCSAEAAAGGSKHIPYRDSKLTRVLQDSLGGTSHTALIICCSPCVENGPETLSSLRFGTRARGIKNRVAVNTRISPEVLQQQLAKAHEKIKELQRQLADVHEKQAAAAAAEPLGLTAADASGDKDTLKPHVDQDACRSSSSSMSTTTTATSIALSALSANAINYCGGVCPAGTTESRCTAALPAGPEAASCQRSSRFARLMRQRVFWWQQLVVTGLSVASVAVYMSWEARQAVAVGACR